MNNGRIGENYEIEVYYRSDSSTHRQSGFVRVYHHVHHQGGDRIISVYVEDNASALEVGKMLQEKGLIRDGRLFMIQELLSEQHDKIRPGVYDLNTNMTAQEILEVIAPEEEEETEE